MGCVRRGDSEHHLIELQRQVRAAANSADTRDGHEMLGCCCSHQEACVQAQVTIHTSPPRRLCSPTLPGSHDPGTTSPGECTARLRLLQRHAGLCRRRLTLHSVLLPPPGLSEPEPPNQLLLLPRPVWVGTDTLRRPTRRVRAKFKAEPQRAVQTKKRKGNFSEQPQEQRIKSPQSI